ncbi:hypothetical protein LZC95_21325 [Pendulispora brunnea]|uniref:Uncharacterized protein n=1 Tax=Pendulispora brunnea TaxID=2905690 RepID=A0ABZ2KQM9_9BACT
MLAAREYLMWDLSSDPVEVQKQLWEISDALKEPLKGKRARWSGRALFSRDEIEDEALDSDEVLAIAGGKLPVLFLNVTFDTNDVSSQDFAEWEARFGLHLLGEVIGKMTNARASKRFSIGRSSSVARWQTAAAGS